MVWVNNSRVAEHYQAEELRVAKDEMRSLRANRQRAARHALERFLAGIAWPVAYPELLERWFVYSSQELVSRAWMGRAPRPLSGFGERWLVRELVARGYRIEGKRRQREPVMHQALMADRTMGSIQRRDKFGAHMWTYRDARMVDVPVGQV